MPIGEMDLEKKKRRGMPVYIVVTVPVEKVFHLLEPKMPPVVILDVSGLKVVTEGGGVEEKQVGGN